MAATPAIASDAIPRGVYAGVSATGDEVRLRIDEVGEHVDGHLD